MTKPGYTHITLLVDRSGSMAEIADDATGGIKAFVAEQAAQPGEATFSLYQFNHEYELVHEPGPIADAPAYVLRPRGNTALFDALGWSMADTGEWLASLPEGERPSTVIFGVVTDGRENASKERNRASVQSDIAEQRDRYGWQFVFLSADLGAVAEARDLGVPAASSAGFDPDAEGAAVAYAALSRSVSRTRSGGGPVRL